MTTTSRRASPKAEASTPEQLAASILALVSSIERHESGAPAAIAFRAALARKGREIAAAGSSAVLGDVLARVRAAAPEKAFGREAILTAAWAGLSGWRR